MDEQLDEFGQLGKQIAAGVREVGRMAAFAAITRVLIQRGWTEDQASELVAEAATLYSEEVEKILAPSRQTVEKMREQAHRAAEEFVREVWLNDGPVTDE